MRVSAFIEPCLPSPADRPPSGPDWIHEIKLDGFRMMVRRDPAGVRLLTRNGYDWTGRFPRIAAAAEALRARSFLIDGEAVACDGDGLPVFVELNGRDMRREPLEVRKRALAAALRVKAGAGIRFNDHCDDLPVDVVFRHACKRLREHREQAARLVLSVGPLARLAEDEKPERTRSEARVRRGLGQGQTVITRRSTDGWKKTI
jgi:bifunctional non-homologous end joining protein LigD